MDNILTDLDRFLALYRSLGIECKVNIEPCARIIYFTDTPEEDWLFDGEVTRSPKLKGYAGFYTKVVFDIDGNFIEQGVWE